MVKVKIFISALFLLLAIGLHGQSNLLRNFYKDIEVFGGAGITSYFGDVGGKDSKITGPQQLFDNLDLDLWRIRGTLSAGIRINPFRFFAITWDFAPLWVSGSDLRSNYASRGYSFNTWIFESSLGCEYYYANRITGYAPYLIGGVSAMLFTFKNNSGSERSKRYPGNSLIIGLGLRLPSETRYTQSIDAGFHFTTTDFLDGFKTARNSNDLFFVVSYKIHMKMYTSWYYDHKGLVR